MNTATARADHNTLSLSKGRKSKSAPRAPKLASATVGYDRLPDKESTVTWLTPRPIIEAFQPVDLDPCTPEEGMPWLTAARMLRPSEDGLKTAWPKDAFVFMNPPYGGHKNSPTSQHRWMEKAAEHGNGVSLVLARMETGWMQEALNHPNVTGVLFTKGRLSFCRPDGVPGQSCPVGSVFIAYGKEGARRLRKVQANGVIRGTYLDLVAARVGVVAGADMGAANHE